MLTRKEIADSFYKVGVRNGDICLFHSSFKSLGEVEGGAQSVIDAFFDVIGVSGTLVAPTLSQKDFENSYKTWNLDKPSDVGYLTEYFRKTPGTFRSDQATHSVAARGALAWELTHEHTAFGPRPCPFGEYAFADSSPWYKMYRLNAKVVFIGVSLVYNTLKHLVEGMFVQKLLDGIAPGEKKDELKGRLRYFENLDRGVWPFYDGRKMHEYLDGLGLVSSTQCGNATLYKIDALYSCDAALEAISAHPEVWYKNTTLQWIEDCLAAQSK
ncbi:MAG: AAC(3) family N-acetyltransferase [Clostridia bacterium]|nr:AAC(3) family N-acetyltransferase [Clostridia bacterium]